MAFHAKKRFSQRKIIDIILYS